MKLYYWTEGEGKNKRHVIVEPSRFVLIHQEIQGLSHTINIDYVAEKRLFLYKNLDKLGELGIIPLDVTRGDSDLLKAIRFFEVENHSSELYAVPENFRVIADFINAYLEG